MKKEDMYSLLGEMDESYIREARAEKKIKKTQGFPLRYVAVAASLILAVTVIFSLHGYGDNSYLTDEGGGVGAGTMAPDVRYTFSLGSFVYEYSSNNIDHERFPLAKEVAVKTPTGYHYTLLSKEHLGEYVGTVPACPKLSLPEGRAYRFLPYPNIDSLLVVDYGDFYSFAYSDGELSGAVGSDTDSALFAYGLPELATGYGIDNATDLKLPDARLSDILGIIGSKESYPSSEYAEAILLSWYEMKGGDGGVTVDGSYHAYESVEVMKEYSAFATRGLRQVLVSTESFDSIRIVIDLEYRDIHFGGRHYRISESKCEKLRELLSVD